MAWTPLESNPEVMNKFLWGLGVPEEWVIEDVFSLDPELLALIPRPTVALILLFPTSEQYRISTEKEEEEVKAKGQKVSKEVYYIKQYISNACGTMALLHAVANNLDQIKLKDGILKSFLDKTKGMSPEEKGEALIKEEAFANRHNTIAQEGQTEVPSDDTPIIHHFAAFVLKDGDLYELDGKKAFPINHGPTTTETFVEDAAKVLTGIMKRDPDTMEFTVCALCRDVSRAI